MDNGLTHVALGVEDLDRSIAFYRTFADMDVVHERLDQETGHRVAWISDLTRPFVIVLMQNDGPAAPLGGFNHLGIGVESRAEVDRRVAEAQAAGHPVLGPLDYGPPVGYWAIVVDPDGHNLELAHGQEVGLTVAMNMPPPPPPSPERGAS